MNLEIVWIAGMLTHAYRNANLCLALAWCISYPVNLKVECVAGYSKHITHKHTKRKFQRQYNIIIP